MRIYLDNAATTALHPEVIETMTSVLRETYGNPSSIHSEGRSARATIEKARKTVANYIGSSIGEVFFTSGGTESNNMALKCAVRDLGVNHIITTQMEHHCVLHTLEQIEHSGQAKITYLPVDQKGRINPADLEKVLENNPEKTLVSLMHSNNEIGTMIDLEQIAGICEQYQALFHTDTVQTIGYFPIDLSKIRINFLSGSAHKFHGPKGIGFVYINNDNIIRPYINGGAQERNMRAGTENIHGIAGLAKALELACEQMDEHRQQIEKVRNHLKHQLQNHFDDIHFNGDHDGRYHYKVLSVSFPPSPKSELLLLNLDILGVSASGGSACSSGAEQGSHVLKAVESEPGRKTIRFSFSADNTVEEINALIEKLKTVIAVKVPA
ncbi:MAG: cysteine desulfurase family protein [Bacteroidota bacterium]